MKWFKYILFSMALLGGDIAANAQDITVDDPWKDYPTKRICMPTIHTLPWE